MHRDGSETPDTQPGRGPLKAAVSWAKRYAETVDDPDIVAIHIRPNVSPTLETGGLELIEVATRWADPLIIEGQQDMANVDIDKLLEGMTSVQIDDLIRRGQAVKEGKRKAEIADAKKAIDDLLAERGLSFGSVYGYGQGTSEPTSRRRSSKPKSDSDWKAKIGVTYAHPDNAEMKWVGKRGQREGWINELLAEGREPVMVME